MATSARAAGPLLAAGGLAVFVSGLLAGTWIGASRVDAGEVPAAAAPGSSELRAAVTALTREVETLRSELAAELAGGGGARTESAELGPLSAELEELRGELLALREASSRRPAGGSDGDVLAGALERRLQSLEELVQQRLVALDGRGAWALRVPAGEPDRRALGDLLVEAREGGAEEVVHRHQLWSYQAVLDHYGAPDQVHVRDDHIEFEYALPDLEDNFDFHFVDGFCVQAH